MLRTLIDQRVSRMINGYFGIVINTGEDNYLRTAEALAAAPSVTASQFINHRLALDSVFPTSRSRSGTPRSNRRPARAAVRAGPGPLTRDSSQLPGELAADEAHGRQPYRTHACDTSSTRHDRHRAGVQTAGGPRGHSTARPRRRPEGVDYVFNFARDIGE
jgi:beta-lysine 5,6-aminomutase alpha subunit